MARAKVIRDLLYGYLRLDEWCLRLVDTPHFQRLKRVRQLTSQDLFPSTNHTRFEHSLGVLALGRRALDAIETNARNPSARKAMRDLRRTVEAALLLHDVGHAPFSHVGEGCYDRSSISGRLKDDHGFELPQDWSEHEAMSALVAVSCLHDPLMAADVDERLLCRAITGHSYDAPDRWAENACVDLVNSACDVDKLDYVVRDNFMTGGQLAAFDYERIVASFTIHKRRLVFLPAALSALAGMVHGRNHMYVWVYNHHTVAYTGHLVATFLEHVLEQDEGLRAQLFSLEGISENLSDDSDVLAALKRHRDHDERCHRLYEQLFHRKHHRALWKTWYEFEATVNDAAQRNRLAARTAEPEGMMAVASELRDAVGAKHEDDLYVVRARFKPFIPGPGWNVYVSMGGENKEFSEFYAPRITADLPPEMVYVYHAPSLSAKDIAKAVNQL